MNLLPPPLPLVLRLIKFVCARLFYAGVVVPLMLIAAFAVAPRVLEQCGRWVNPMTLVQPIQVSADFADDGYTGETLQHELVDTLGELRSAAESVTPATDTERVLSEFKVPDISVPGTTLSIRPLIEFARTLLRRDSTVYGSVVGTPAGFSALLTLRDPNGRTIPLGTRITPELRNGTHIGVPAQLSAVQETLRSAAEDILAHQSPLLYAAYLTETEQRRCLGGEYVCRFDEVRENFEQIAAGGGGSNDDNARENAAWAMLALSKLDTYAGNFEGTILRARQIVELGARYDNVRKVQPWAYYNWGVALNDIGCYQQAAQVLEQMFDKTHDYAHYHNALARSYLALARAESRDGRTGGLASEYRSRAIDHLRTAVRMNPAYQEAYVNLGDAISLPDGGANVASQIARDAALEAYRTAVALSVDDAGRAFERLSALNDSAYLKVKDRITRRRPQCESGMARSLLESWGCSDAQIDAAALRAPASLKPASVAPEKPPAVCNRPELMLPGDLGARGVRVGGAKTIAVESDGHGTRGPARNVGPREVERVAAGRG